MVQLRKKIVDQRMKRFEEVCRESGVKLTYQRMEVFREVAGTEDHPDAETVFHGVRKRIPTISLDTVYRTLWTLNDLGLIKTLGASRERSRFDANLDQHHHFVCTQCGHTYDFISETLNNLHLPDSVDELGKIESTLVEVRGVCHKCAKKAGTKKSNITK